MQETLFQVAKHQGPDFSEKTKNGRAAPHRIRSGNGQRCVSNLFQLYFKLHFTLAWVHFPKIIRKIGWHDPWRCKSSENHTHARVRGSKGAIIQVMPSFSKLSPWICTVSVGEAPSSFSKATTATGSWTQLTLQKENSALTNGKTSVAA